MAEQAFHDNDDPADLPLFTQVLSTRPGRVRSTFSMRNDPVASRQDLTEALDRLHQPRDAFKFMYRCLSEHCASVTKGQEEWKIPRHVLMTVLKTESERVQQVYRGIRPG